MLPVADVLLVLGLRAGVGVNEALGDEREQLLLRHLARIRVQVDHILQQQHVTDGEERAGPVVVLVDDGGAAAEEVDGPRLVHHLEGLGRRRGRRVGIQRAQRRRRRGQRGRVRGHGSPPRSPVMGLGGGRASPETRTLGSARSSAAAAEDGERIGMAESGEE